MIRYGTGHERIERFRLACFLNGIAQAVKQSSAATGMEVEYCLSDADANARSAVVP